MSVEQLYLLNTLASQSSEYILSHLKTNYTHGLQNEEIKSKLVTESSIYDSSVHSTEDNSKLLDEENYSISLSENIMNTQSNVTLFSKK